MMRSVEDAGQNVELDGVLTPLKLIRHMDCPLGRGCPPLAAYHVIITASQS
jgi:hypothetical protein